MNLDPKIDGAYKECPDCSTKIPYHPGYITWCECGYNLKLLKIEEKKSRMERLYEHLGEKSGSYIFEKMINETVIRPKISFVNGLALVIATIVHLFCLAAFLLGGYLLIFNHSHFMYLIWGLILLGFSWVTRPRVNKLDKEQQIVPREKLPELYEMMDQLADKMGVKKIDGIIVNEEYNAWISRFGWNRKTIVGIGLPLFSTLSPEEQCAIMAHELGHYKNRDLMYGFYFNTALSTLALWYSLLEPVPREHQFEHTLLEIVTDFFIKIISYIPYFLYSFLLHLIWSDSQKREFLADYRAGEICGSQVIINALEKMHLDDVYYHTLSKVSIQNEQGNVIDLFNISLSSMPDREKKRLKLRLSNEIFKLNTTHPPTIFRIQFIEKLNLSGCFPINPEKARKITAELDSMKEIIHERAVENYRYDWLN